MICMENSIGQPIEMTPLAESSDSCVVTNRLLELIKPALCFQLTPGDSSTSECSLAMLGYLPHFSAQLQHQHHMQSALQQSSNQERETVMDLRVKRRDTTVSGRSDSGVMELKDETFKESATPRALLSGAIASPRGRPCASEIAPSKANTIKLDAKRELTPPQASVEGINQKLTEPRTSRSYQWLGERHKSASGSSGPNKITRATRRNRTMFSEWQLNELEWRFIRNKYLITSDRIRVAKMLNLEQLQVKTWFQNRRMKWKKQILASGSNRSPTKPKGRPRRNSIPPIDPDNEDDRAG